MSKAEGKKIVLKFNEALVMPEIVMSDVPESIIPEIKSYTKGTNSSNSYSTPVTTPNDVVAGDLLILFWHKDGSQLESNLNGWTELATATDGSAMRHSIYYKYAIEEGEESFTVTHDSQTTNWIVIAIPYGDEITCSVNAYTINASPNPPIFDPGFEAGTNILWIASAGCDYRTITGFPSNFIDNNISQNNAGGVAIASKNSSNSSEDPDIFNMSGTDQAEAFTMAITSKKYDDIYKIRLSTELNKGFNITGQQPLYVELPAGTLGELISLAITPSLVTEHPTEANALLLEFLETNHFKNVTGNLTIAYDKLIGILTGLGGVVESFTETFTPSDLVRTINPYLVENIDVSGEGSFLQTAIVYGYGYTLENLNATGVGSFVKTKVNDDPL